MKRDKHDIDKTLSPEVIEKYLSGSLSHEEMNKVEKLMLNSDFDSEAMEGFEAHSGFIRNDMNVLQNKIDQRTTKKKKALPWLKIAASLGLLIITSIAILKINWSDNEQISLNQDKTTDDNIEQPIINNTPAGDQTIEEANTETKSEEPEQSITKATKPKIYARKMPVETAPTPKFSKTEEETAVAQKTPATNRFSNEIAMTDELAMEDMAEPEADIKALEIEAEVAQPTAKEHNATSRKKLTIRGSSSIRPSVDPQIAKKISGKISNTIDEPIINALVIIMNTTYGQVSNIDGEFTVVYPDTLSDVQLQIFSIGYKTQTIPLNPSDSTLSITMEEDLIALSEVVITSYGTERDNDSQDEIYTPAKPAINQKAYKNYLKENIRYPNDSKQEGKITVSFVVNTDGSLSDFKIKKGINEAYNKEAIRLIKEGPAWLPAQKGNNNTSSKVKVKVKF